MFAPLEISLLCGTSNIEVEIASLHTLLCFVNWLLNDLKQLLDFVMVSTSRILSAIHELNVSQFVTQVHASLFLYVCRSLCSFLSSLPYEEWRTLQWRA